MGTTSFWRKAGRIELGKLSILTTSHWYLCVKSMWLICMCLCQMHNILRFVYGMIWNILSSIRKPYTYALLSGLIGKIEPLKYKFCGLWTCTIWILGFAFGGTNTFIVITYQFFHRHFFSKLMNCLLCVWQLFKLLLH